MIQQTVPEEKTVDRFDASACAPRARIDLLHADDALLPFLEIADIGQEGKDLSGRAVNEDFKLDFDHRFPPWAYRAQWARWAYGMRSFLYDKSPSNACRA